jgi:phasin family protein
MASKGRKPAGATPAAKAPVTSKAPAKPKAAAPKPVTAKAPAKAVAKPVTKPAAIATPVVATKPVEIKPVETPPVAKAELPESAPVVAAAPEPVIETAAAAPVIEMAAEPEVKAPEAPAPEPVNIVEAPAVAVAPAAIIQKEVITMEATIKNATEKAQTLFAEANERAKAAVEKGTKLFEEANEFSKGNVEAIVESGKIAAKGIETLGQDAADYSRKQFEGATAALKSLASVKSPTDFFKLHSDYVRSSFDSIVAQTSKNTEAMLKLAGEVAQPISNRVAVAAEKVKIAA